MNIFFFTLYIRYYIISYLIIIVVAWLVYIENVLLVVELYLVSYLLALLLFLSRYIIWLNRFNLFIFIVLLLITIIFYVFLVSFVYHFLLLGSFSLCNCYLLVLLIIRLQLVWLVDHAMILWRLEMHLEIWLVIELRMYIIFGLFRELDASLNKGWCLDLSSTRGLQNWSEVKLYLLLILECALLINLVLIYLKVNWSICLVHFLTFKRLIFLTSE